MITIKGIFKGVKRREYDFKNAKGEPVQGVSHKAYLEMEDSNLTPDECLKEIKLSTPNFVPSAKKGEAVEWVIDINKSGQIILISENQKK